uniref:NXPE C-terminal domain-containing protein n=1 Tax=Sinocyclocheilus rhinocerous TaxID=307959 RepID=A0A673IY04_9TELE
SWSFCKHSPPSFLSQHFAGLSNSPNSTSPSGFSSEESVVRSFYSEFGISLDGYSRLQQAIYWDGPDRSITSVSTSTSPAHTTFNIENLKKSYQTGEELFVTVHAKDFDSKSKSYGGDFFQAKLFWSKTKYALMEGSMTDKHVLFDRKQTNKGINGDKSIIKIVHSHGNETIGMLVNSLTQRNSTAQMLGNMFQNNEFRYILGKLITLLHYLLFPFTHPADVAEKCHPGLHTPVPAGFYLNDVWTSFVCSTRHFTTQTTTECLKDKHIYMMGDSTMRQWFDFFVKVVPTLKQMNLHVQYQSGPLLAVDVKNNIDLHWRAHGIPLRSRKSAVANLHYISNEIDDLAGGSHTVIMFHMGPHFTTYPLDFYTHRVLRIRKAVLALLQRAPDTTVIIKTVNTGYKVSLCKFCMIIKNSVKIDLCIESWSVNAN